MTTTTQTKTRLNKMSAGDTAWDVPYNAGMDNFEARWRYRGTSAPSNPFAGMLWIDSTTANLDVYKVYDGASAWAIVGYHNLSSDLWFPSINSLSAMTDPDEAADYFVALNAGSDTTLPQKILSQYVSPVGTQTVMLLAQALKPKLTSGCAALAWEETATDKLMFGYLAFDPASNEYAMVSLPMPKGWNNGTIQLQFIWGATATGNVVWGANAVAISNDDPLNASLGTPQTVTDGVTATTDLMVTSYTAAITVAGTPAAEDLLLLQIYRDGSNGSDTCTSDAKLYAVRLKFTRAKATDV